LLARGKGDLIRYSDSFPDAAVLLAECARLGLEGIVCKRKDALSVGLEGREPIPYKAL
jgi:hypothetical protein